MDGNIAGLLHSLFHIMNREMNRSLSEFGLTCVQARILLLLLQGDRKREIYDQKDIEKMLDIQKSSVTSLLKAMEKNGWIQRVKDGRDRRRKRVTVTYKARSFEENAVHRAGQEEMLFRQLLNPEEGLVLEDLLQKLLTGMRKGKITA